MAILQDTEDQEQRESGDLALGGEESPELTQGVSAPSTAQSMPSSDRRGTSAGSRFSGLKKYVEANRGAGMAGKIQTGIEKIRGGIETGLGTAKTGLQQASEAEKSRLTKGEELIRSSQEGGRGLLEQGKTTAFTQDISPKTRAEQIPVSGQLTGTTGQIQSFSQPVQEPIQTPDFSEYGSTAADRLAAFQKYKEGQAEQLSIQDEAALQQQISELQKRADLSKSEQGRYQLLRETFGRPGYATGQQRLDQLILQASPEESQKLREMTQGIAQPITQQMSELQALKQAEQDVISKQAGGLSSTIAKKLYGETGQPVIDPNTGKVLEVGGALGEFQTDIQRRLENERANVASQFGAIQNIVERGYDITPQMLSDLGVTDPNQQKQFMDYYSKGQGRTLSSAVQQGGFDIDELRQIAQKTGTDYNQMKELYTGTPVSIQEFSTRIGKDYASASPENKALIEQNYNKYSQDLAAQSADYRANLEGYVGENLGSLRVKGPEIDYSQFLRELSPEQITAAKVATAEDFARQAALEQLAGLGFGPLQQSQIGEAGTLGQLGYGRFDIGKALGEARSRYEAPTYDEYGRVTPAQVGLQPTIGEQLQTGFEGITQAGAEKIGEIPLIGGITESSYGQPIAATSEQYMKGITTPLTDYETGAMRVLEGDIGGLGQIGIGSITGGIQTATTPAVGVEKLITGGERIEGLSQDYTDALRGLTYGDFNAARDSIKSTYKLPEQMTRDAAAKVDSIISEAEKAVENTWKTVTSAAGSFFCTHIFKLGLVSKEEYRILNEFLHEIKNDYSEFLNWYINNAPKIIKLSNGFDWKIGKVEIFDNLIPKYLDGDILGAVKCYGEFVKKICEFTGIECHEEHYNTQNKEKYQSIVQEFYGDK